jgi:putative intracellular protease/amidase
MLVRMAARTVLIPIPRQDFDPTEVAVSWQVLTDAGHRVVFATPDGRPGAADDLMLSGNGFDPWGKVPGLNRFFLLGRVLRADNAARTAYARMLTTSAFRKPIRWDEIDLYDGLLLPGGHRARGMREYLESPALQAQIVKAFQHAQPVAAICHGVLLVARSIDPQTGDSVLRGRRTTALTWSLERRAWQLTRRTRFWDPDYYRTYLESPGEPPGYMSVQQEVTRALAAPEDFLDAPPTQSIKRDGRHRDTATDAGPAFVVQDGHYVSARWPGDTHTFAQRLADLLAE